MKKTFTLLCVAFFAAIMGLSTINAQSYYAKDHINETFDGLLEIPAGWSVISTNGASAFGKNGGISITNDALRFTGGGSGARGAEIKFPTPQSNPILEGKTTFFLEFDWTVGGVINDYSGALGLTVMGSNSSFSSAEMYFDVIFGLYVINDGFIHYWNKDIDGPIDPDRSEVDGTEHRDSLVFYGTYNSSMTGFERAQLYSADLGYATVDFSKTAELNASTLTSVTYTYGATYHVKAELDFATQQVVSLTITDNDDETNTETIAGMPFCSPTASDLAIIDIVNTRGVSSSAPNSDLNCYVDNLWIYALELSLGQADVTIKYVDQNGTEIKTPRTASNQEVSVLFSATANDKMTFSDNSGTHYYAYDEQNTPFDNLVVDLDAGKNVITLHFIEWPYVNGTYKWNGATNFYWTELDANFTVAGVAQPLAYQNNNPAEFSDASAPIKDIIIDQVIQLGDKDMNVLADGYGFEGKANITGIGTLNVIMADPEDIVTLGVPNLLDGGVNVSKGTVKITHSEAAKKFQVADGTNLILGTAFNKPVEGDGGTLNITIGNNISSPAITNVSTVNLNVASVGSINNNNWTGAFTTVFPEGDTQINVIDATDQDRESATYAVQGSSIRYAKVHLGENTRLMPSGTAGAGGTTSIRIGELSGAAGSSIEGNTVSADNRTVEWIVGGLNTDAVFEGNINPLLMPVERQSNATGKFFAETASGDTIWYVPAPLKIGKEGTGKWTVGGKITLPEPDYPHTITVSNGILELCDAVIADPINAITLTVEPEGTLQTHGNFIGAYTVTINGTMDGGAEFAGGFIMASPESSVLKLKINSFANGDFEKIKTAGDIAIRGGVLDFTVVNHPAQDAEILILESESNYDIMDNMDNIIVRVNGEDITENTIDTVVPDGFVGLYYFEPEQGLLGFLRGNGNGLYNILDNKLIQSVEYYNLLGQKVTENNLGVTLKKITYTDNSVQTIKTINQAK